MTKFSWFWLVCIIGLYIASARVYYHASVNDLYRHPLFIFSVLVLGGLVLSLRMEQNFKSTLLFIMTLILSIVCGLNYVGG